MGLELLLYSFDGSPVAPMRPISNSPEMLLAQALRNDAVQATASARLTTHNSLMMNNGQGRWSVSWTWSRDSCFWSGPGYCRSKRSVDVVRSAPIRLIFLTSSLVTSFGCTFAARSVIKISNDNSASDICVTHIYRSNGKYNLFLR